MRRPLYRGFPMDEGLLRDVAGVPVRRLPRAELRYLPRLLHRVGWRELGVRADWLIPVDGFIGWVPFAIAAGEAEIRRQRPDAILSTSAPFSAHLVGAWLAKRHGIPWLSDYRDPWTTNDLYPTYAGQDAVSRYKTAVDSRVERALLQAADHISVVVDRHRDDIVARFDVPADRVSVIYNGFDEADFVESPYPIPPHRDVFRLSYIGAFQQGHDASDLLPMWRALLQRPDVNRARARLRFVGESSVWMRERADSWRDVADTVELLDYVPHAEVPGIMRASTALFIVFSRPWVVTGKLFEYLRSGLPVFGIATEYDTVMERMLREAGTGTVVRRDEQALGAEVLHRLYQETISGEFTHAPDRRVVMAHSRASRTRDMVRVLDQIVGTDR